MHAVKHSSCSSPPKPSPSLRSCSYALNKPTSHCTPLVPHTPNPSPSLHSCSYILSELTKMLGREPAHIPALTTVTASLLLDACASLRTLEQVRHLGGREVRGEIAHHRHTASLLLGACARLRTLEQVAAQTVTHTHTHRPLPALTS